MLLDLLLQQSLHGVLGGHVQRKLSLAVDRPDVGAVLDQVPVRTRHVSVRNQSISTRLCATRPPPGGDSLGDLDEAAGGGSVQRRPALVVAAVDVAAALHQELDHLGVLINAGLKDTHTHTLTVGHSIQ